MIRAIIKFILMLAEKITSELALIASLLSLVRSGSYLDRVLGGMILIWKSIEGFFVAFMEKKNFIDVMNHFADVVEATIVQAGKTIEEDPQTALASFVGAFVFYKLIAIVLKAIRIKLLKKREKKADQKPPETKTYEKLYQGDSGQGYTTK